MAELREKDLAKETDLAYVRAIDADGRSTIVSKNDLMLQLHKVNHDKGYFTTEANLKAAYPFANKGDKAYVGKTYPYQVWNYENGKWVNSGATGGETSIDIGQLDKKNTEQDTRLTNIETTLGKFGKATVVKTGVTEVVI